MIRICPAFNAFYYAYYVQGLAELFSGAALRFTSRPFPAFASDKLAFIDDRGMRFLIDAADRAQVDEEGLEWSDVYGKVNLLREVLPLEHSHKVMPIGPGFALKIWNRPSSWRKSFLHYFRARRGIENARKHFANYRRQYRYALDEDSFTPGISSDDYIFSSNTLWKDDLETNAHRVRFFDAARSIPGVTFEGGFSRRRRDDVPGFEEYTADRRFPIDEYVRNVRRSAVVFNTPAVRDCHGWKLGEYFALGKAIISTPLKRELPQPLVHGEAVHTVEPSMESIRSAIQLLVADRSYRTRLERGAREYYLAYLRPRRVLERMIAFGAGAASAEHRASSRLGG